MHLNLVYRAYRAPYAWVPQLEVPPETAIARLDVTTFRVPGAAAIGRHRVVEIAGGDNAQLIADAGGGHEPGGALCVTSDHEQALQLSAGG